MMFAPNAADVPNPIEAWKKVASGFVARPPAVSAPPAALSSAPPETNVPSAISSEMRPMLAVALPADVSVIPKAPIRVALPDKAV